MKTAVLGALLHSRTQADAQRNNFREFCTLSLFLCDQLGVHLVRWILTKISDGCLVRPTISARTLTEPEIGELEVNSSAVSICHDKRQLITLWSPGTGLEGSIWIR